MLLSHAYQGPALRWCTARIFSIASVVDHEEPSRARGSFPVCEMGGCGSLAVVTTSASHLL